jgi:hypothetical protein
MKDLIVEIVASQAHSSALNILPHADTASLHMSSFKMLGVLLAAVALLMGAATTGVSATSADADTGIRRTGRKLAYWQLGPFGYYQVKPTRRKVGGFWVNYG